MAHAPSTISPATFRTFGELLRYLRRRQRMTQIELAIAVGYSTAQVSRLEQNLRRPNPSTLQAFFIPALGLEDQPDWATRLLELAHTTRDDEYADSALPEQAPIDAPHSTGQKSDTAQPDPQVFDYAPSGHVLVTKLYLPRPRRDLVARPRLLALLGAALHMPLTLVSAPAGFGKTTLLASWLAPQSSELNVLSSELPDHAQNLKLNTQNFSAAWLSLDDGDNDPGTFLRYLVSALQTLIPTIGHTALALLQTSQPPLPETIVRLLLNDLTALPEPSLLVLDDYHLIRM
jgi:transcriptional regulator with XRE-family HTH domain